MDGDFTGKSLRQQFLLELKHLLRKRLHIWVLGHDGRRITTASFIRNHFILVASVIIGIISVMTYCSLRYFHAIEQKVVYQIKAESLQKENTSLKSSFAQVQGEMASITKRMNDSEQRLASLATKAKVKGLIREKSAGGPLIPSSEFSESHISIDALNEILGELSTKSTIINRETKELEQQVNRKIAELALIPSIWPVKGMIMSGFGFRRDPITGQSAFHEGIDIQASFGHPIISPADGIVTFAGWQSGFGRSIEISHGNGIITRYAHLSSYNVSAGGKVTRRDIIGYVGASGRATGPHLHYEILKNGKLVNPLSYIVSD